MGPDDHSHLIWVASGFAILITCVAILLRLLARKVQKLPLGADDHFILVGAVSQPRTITKRALFIIFRSSP